MKLRKREKKEINTDKKMWDLEADTLDSLKSSKLWLNSHVCRLFFTYQIFKKAFNVFWESGSVQYFFSITPANLLKHPVELLKHSAKQFKVSQSWLKQKLVNHDSYSAEWRLIFQEWSKFANLETNYWFCFV